MDFYTVKTKVNLVEDETACRLIEKHIGFYCQPDIIGEPFEDDDAYYLRFAVRTNGLRDMMKHFVMSMSEHFPVELVKTTRL